MGDKQTRTRRNRPGPALSSEARERQLINLAVDLAEQRLLDGTASNQVIVHFLKLASVRENLEREKLEKENELLRAKTAMLESARRSDELYAEALAAFRSYTPATSDDT